MHEGTLSCTIPSVFYLCGIAIICRCSFYFVLSHRWSNGSASLVSATRSQKLLMSTTRAGLQSERTETAKRLKSVHRQSCLPSPASHSALAE